MRISDWSSDVCSSDLSSAVHSYLTIAGSADLVVAAYDAEGAIDIEGTKLAKRILDNLVTTNDYTVGYSDKPTLPAIADELRYMTMRSEEHKSELQSLMRISYAVISLKKKIQQKVVTIKTYPNSRLNETHIPLY